MITIEAIAMVLLAAVAVYIAYTKLSCTPEDPRIAWLPEEPAVDGAEATLPAHH